MKIKTQTIVRKIYKSGLFIVLVVIAFFMKWQNSGTTGGLIESTSADVVYSPDGDGDGGDDCPSDDDGPDGPCDGL